MKCKMYVALFAALLAAQIGIAQTVTVKDDSVPVYTPITIKADCKDTIQCYWVLPPGLTNMSVPNDDLKPFLPKDFIYPNKTIQIFSGAKERVYTITVVAAAKGGTMAATTFKLTVGKPAKPDVDPADPVIDPADPVIDPVVPSKEFQEAVLAAFAKDSAPRKKDLTPTNKTDTSGYLASLYRNAGKDGGTADDKKLTTVDQLFIAMHSMFLDDWDPYALFETRLAIAKETDKQIPRKVGVALDDATRKKAKALFLQISKALEAAK